MRRTIHGPEHNQRIAQFVAEQLGHKEGFARFQAIGIEGDGEIIAGATYDYYNGACLNMHIASKGKHWITREALHFAFWYPFVQLGVKRINGFIPASRKEAIRFAEHLGFVHEHTLKHGAPDCDMLLYRMLKDECRWLNMKVRYVQT